MLSKIANKIANKIAQDHTKSDLKDLITKIVSFGYKPIIGLMELGGGSVYDVWALSKNPDAWEPYKGNRYVKNSESYVIGYEYNDELTSQNMAEEMIYEETSQDWLLEGEKSKEVNTEKYRLIPIGNLISRIEGHPGTLERIKDILSAVDPELSQTAEVLEKDIEYWSEIRLDK
jgi:hypothetical protein